MSGKGVEVRFCANRTMSLRTELAVGYRPAPGPASVLAPIFTLLIRTYNMQKENLLFIRKCHFGIDLPITTIIAFEKHLTMLPGPLAAASGLLSGTIVGDTNTDKARVPSSLVATTAVPSSLIVLRRIFAYSKSTAVILEMPVVGTLGTETVLPKASLATHKNNAQYTD